MVDSVDQATRSVLMSRIRSKNTRPELAVRKMLFAAGYRYRLHVRALPGSPDLVFHARKKVIFVHGCFWHMHDNCKFARMPKTRTEFWHKKLRGNKARDDQIGVTLVQSGWQVLVVWECELRDMETLEDKVRDFLGPARK